MTITAVVVLEALTAADLNALIATSITAGNQPFGAPFTHVLAQGGSRICQAMIAGSQVLVGDQGDLGTPGAAGADGVCAAATVTLSSANLLALNATPIDLVAAPGAGKILVPIRVTLEHIFNTTGYAVSGNLQLQYNGGGGIATLIAPAGLLDTAASQAAAPAAPTLNALTSASINKSLQLKASAALTTGDGTLKVTYYAPFTA